MRSPSYKQPMAKVALVFVILVLLGAIPVEMVLPGAIVIVALDLILPWTLREAKLSRK